MAQVVVVRFKKGCKPYYFGAGGLTLEQGQGVIVETARGLEYAIVVDPLREVPDESVVQPLKNVIRIATERDKAVLAEQEARRPEAMRICKEKIAARELPMKLIDCEFTFDGSKVVFTFTSEGRVDFRELVRDLASVFHLRIELRQVGIRDEARILGGIAPCGREVCCAGCMPDFKKVSIKMAKNQGLSLNPGKISGLCGRLMCCLAYEDEYYAAVCKQVPKLGANVSTPEGRGSVGLRQYAEDGGARQDRKGRRVRLSRFPADQVRRGEQMPDKADKEGKERAETEQAPLPSAEDELAAADGSRPKATRVRAATVPTAATVPNAPIVPTAAAVPRNTADRMPVRGRISPAADTESPTANQMTHAARAATGTAGRTCVRTALPRPRVSLPAVPSPTIRRRESRRSPTAPRRQNATRSPIVRPYRRPRSRRRKIPEKAEANSAKDFTNGQSCVIIHT